MVQQGQTIELTRRGADGRPLRAYRYRTGGRDSKRVQRGGFASEQDARDALERDPRDGREHAIKPLDALNAPEFDPWTLVDARWTETPAGVTSKNKSDA